MNSKSLYIPYLTEGLVNPLNLILFFIKEATSHGLKCLQSEIMEKITYVIKM